MKAVIQRVNGAVCRVGGRETGACKKGLCVMLGVTQDDTVEDAALLAAKIAKMRIFRDENDKMNLSVNDVGGGALVISNFTLCGDCSHGNRPEFTQAMKPAQAKSLYEHFVSLLSGAGCPVGTGMFGEHMDISLELDGPVTIVLDSNDLKRRRQP